MFSPLCVVTETKNKQLEQQKALTEGHPMTIFKVVLTLKAYTSKFFLSLSLLESQSINQAPFKTRGPSKVLDHVQMPKKEEITAGKGQNYLIVGSDGEKCNFQK